jgi:hypothetical protein
MAHLILLECKIVIVIQKIFLNMEIQSIDWLIICCFMSRSRIFHLYGDVTIAAEGLQNLVFWTIQECFIDKKSFLHGFKRYKIMI